MPTRTTLTHFSFLQASPCVNEIICNCPERVSVYRKCFVGRGYNISLQSRFDECFLQHISEPQFVGYALNKSEKLR